MRKINVVLFSDLPGGTAPHHDDRLQVEFHRAEPDGWLPEVAGAIWVLIDWVPYALSGLEICRRLRCNPRTGQAHITMVLEDDDTTCRRRATAAGANDTLVGPIDRATVLDRILGRDALDLSDDPQVLVQIRDLVVDSAAFQVRWRDKPIPMMPIQLRLLRFFMEHPGQIHTRAQLMAALGNEAPLEERTVDVWIGRLRRSLREAGAGHLLRTVRSLGYAFDSPRGRRSSRTAA